MLNDIFRDRIGATDDTLINALRAVFKSRVEEEKPRIGETDDNLLLGAKYRAYNDAQSIIDKAFKDIEVLRTQKVNNKSFNKAL